MRALIGVVLALLAGTASAATIEDCNALPDGQRLDCYDRVLGVQPSSPEEVKRRTEPCADQIQRYREDEYMRAQRHEPSMPPPHCMSGPNRDSQEEMAQERAAAVERERNRAKAEASQLMACGRTPVTRQAILEGRLIIGMTDEEARCSLRYASIHVNRTTSVYGVSEQWVIGRGSDTQYLYFNNGILTTIQD